MKFMSLEKDEYMFPAEMISKRIKATKRQEKYILTLRKALDHSLSIETGLFYQKIDETRNMVRILRLLQARQKALRKQIDDLLQESEFNDLKAMHGFKTMTIAYLIYLIKDIRKFYVMNEDESISNTKSLAKFRNYCGFTVTSNQSGNKVGSGRLVKSNSKLRTLFFLMALCNISRIEDNDIKDYYVEKCTHMIRKKAAIKAASHMCAKTFYLLKDLDWDFEEKKKEEIDLGLTRCLDSSSSCTSGMLL